MTEKKPICIVNALSLIPPLSGVGRVTLELSRRLFASDPPFRPYYYYGYYSRNLMDTDVDQNRAELDSGLLRHAARIVRANPFLRRCVRRAIRELRKFHTLDADFYWEPNHVVLPEIKANCVMVTVHDLSCMLYRQWHPQERLDFFDRHFRLGLERADLIVAVSETVKNEIVEHCRIPAEKIRFIHNGVDDRLFRPLPQEELDAFRKKRELPERYALYVGSIEPRKNLENLLNAWMLEAEKHRREGCKLLLISNAGWKNGEIIERICEGEKQKVIERRTNVPTLELPYYYNCADLFAYLSLYEGFGLPPVEAHFCGTPVLTSDIPIHREVMGDAAHYVEPGDIGKICDRMGEILAMGKTTRQANFEEGDRNLRGKYSWERCAADYRELFKQFAHLESLGSAD